MKLYGSTTLVKIKFGDKIVYGYIPDAYANLYRFKPKAGNFEGWEKLSVMDFSHIIEKVDKIPPEFLVLYGDSK